MAKSIMKGRVVPEKERYCPNCGRYIGPVETCPYCRSVVEKRKEIVYVKYGALICGIIGMLIFHQIAVAFTNPKVELEDVTKTYNYAYVEISGTVDDPPGLFLKESVDPELVEGSLNFNVEDTTDIVRVKAYEDAFRQMKAQGKIPTFGDRVTIKGQVSWHGDQLDIGLNSADQLDIYRPEPEYVMLEELYKDLENLRISKLETYYEPNFEVKQYGTADRMGHTYNCLIAEQTEQRYTMYTSERIYESNTRICLGFEDFTDQGSANLGWGPINLELSGVSQNIAIPDSNQAINPLNHPFPIDGASLTYEGLWGDARFDINVLYTEKNATLWTLEASTEYWRPYISEYEIVMNKSETLTWSELVPFIPCQGYGISYSFPNFELATKYSKEEEYKGKRVNIIVERVEHNDQNYEYRSTVVVYTPFGSNFTAIIDKASGEIIESDLLPKGTHDPFVMPKDIEKYDDFDSMHILRQSTLEHKDWVRVTGLMFPIPPDERYPEQPPDIGYTEYRMLIGNHFGYFMEANVPWTILTILGEKSPLRDEWPSHPQVGEVIEISGALDLQTWGRSPEWVLVVADPADVKVVPKWRW